MRALGWGLVVLLFAGSAFCLWAASRVGAQLESTEMKQAVRTLSSPLVQRYAPDLVAEGIGHVRGMKEAEWFFILTGIGAAGLGILSAIIMAATASSRGAGGNAMCGACGVPIRSGTLCDNCRA